MGVATGEDPITPNFCELAEFVPTCVVTFTLYEPPCMPEGTTAPLMVVSEITVPVMVS